jgi:hypothetical protein
MDPMTSDTKLKVLWIVALQAQLTGSYASVRPAFESGRAERGVAKMAHNTEYKRWVWALRHSFHTQAWWLRLRPRLSGPVMPQGNRELTGHARFHRKLDYKDMISERKRAEVGLKPLNSREYEC